MSKRTMWVAALCSVPAMWSLALQAQNVSDLPPQVAEEARARAVRAAQHIVVTHGKTAPEKIPLSDQMRGLLTTIAGASQLKGELTSDDVQLLRDHAARERETIESIREEVRAGFRQTCATRRVMNALSLATSFQRMDEEEALKFSDYYRSVLDSLSPGGKAAVLKYLATEVVPYTVRSSIDYVGLAADLPEQITARVALACANQGRVPAYSIGTIER